MEYKEPVWVRFTYNSSEGIIEVQMGNSFFLYATEEYKQLRQLSPLVMGVIYSSERSLA